MKPVFSKIEKQVRGKKGSLEETFYMLMERLHLSYSDIMNLPIPAMFELVRILNKKLKKEKKKIKK